MFVLWYNKYGAKKGVVVCTAVVTSEYARARPGHITIGLQGRE